MESLKVTIKIQDGDYNSIRVFEEPMTLAQVNALNDFALRLVGNEEKEKS